MYVKCFDKLKQMCILYGNKTWTQAYTQRHYAHRSRLKQEKLYLVFYITKKQQRQEQQKHPNLKEKWSYHGRYGHPKKKKIQLRVNETDRLLFAILLCISLFCGDLIALLQKWQERVLYAYWYARKKTCYTLCRLHIDRLKILFMIQSRIRLKSVCQKALYEDLCKHWNIWMSSRECLLAAEMDKLNWKWTFTSEVISFISSVSFSRF